MYIVGWEATPNMQKKKNAQEKKMEKKRERE